MTSISPTSVTPVQSQNIGAMDKVPQEKLYLPGAYTIPPEILRTPRYEKKGGFFSFVGKLLLTAGAVGLAAIVVRRLPMRNYKVLDKLAPDASRLDVIKNVFAKYTDKLYSALGTCKNSVVKFFTSKKKIAETGMQAADEVISAVAV